jgi:hypothetical protein
MGTCRWNGWIPLTVNTWSGCLPEGVENKVFYVLPLLVADDLTHFVPPTGRPDAGGLRVPGLDRHRLPAKRGSLYDALQAASSTFKWTKSNIRLIQQMLRCLHLLVMNT